MPTTLGGGKDVCRLIGQFAGTFSARNNKSGGAIALLAAIVEPEWLYDPTAVVVFLPCKRPAVHDSPGVCLRVSVGREGNSAHSGRADAGLVEEPSHSRTE